MTHAARQLGISRNTLYRRLKQMQSSLARYDHAP
jgi:transcriptional regulator of acetoin/glycerol metabolism